MNQLLYPEMYGSKYGSFNNNDDDEKGPREDQAKIFDDSENDDRQSCFPLTVRFALLVVGMWKPFPPRLCVNQDQDEHAAELRSLVIDDPRKFEDERNMTSTSDVLLDGEEGYVPMDVDFISLQETRRPKKSRSKCFIIHAKRNREECNQKLATFNTTFWKSFDSHYSF